MQIPRYLRAGAPNTPRCRILLNGVEQRDVVEANLDEGWLIKYVSDAEGNYVLEGDGVLLSAKIHGVVVAELT